MAEIVERKVRSGACASVGEFVRAAIERGLRDEVVPGHAEYLADLSKAVPPEEILGRVTVRRRAGNAKQGGVRVLHGGQDFSRRAGASDARAAYLSAGSRLPALSLAIHFSNSATCPCSSSTNWAASVRISGSDVLSRTAL